MSWCDKLASTASVGLRLDPHFASGEALLTALTPITNKLVADEKMKFSLNLVEPFSFTFTTEDGFQYGADHAKVFVGFQHKLKVKQVSGGPPEMEMLSHPLPFTELLPAVSLRLVEATMLMPNVKARALRRVGVVAQTNAAAEDLPPGIARFIQYIGRPWNGLLEHYNISIHSEVGKGSGHTDRCTHTIIRPEDEEQLLTLNFDYQRVFSAPGKISRDSLMSLVEGVQRSATNYFEDLAEGNRFDEKLIGKASSTTL